MVKPITTGVSQLATTAAVPPANPSSENTAAAVQFGTAAATPTNAPTNVDLLVVGSGSSIVSYFLCSQSSETRQEFRVCAVRRG